MKATLSDDGKTFSLVGNEWSNEYPIEELNSWLNWYRKMKVDHPKSGNNYDPTISALTQLAEELEKRPTANEGGGQ